MLWYWALKILDLTQNTAIFPGKELSEARGFQRACTCLRLCPCLCPYLLYCSPKQGDKSGITPYLPSCRLSDLSLKHLVLASIRDRILTLVSKQSGNSHISRHWTQTDCFLVEDGSYFLVMLTVKCHFCILSYA